MCFSLQGGDAWHVRGRVRNLIHFTAALENARSVMELLVQPGLDVSQPVMWSVSAAAEDGCSFWDFSSRHGRTPLRFTLTARSGSVMGTCPQL